ncbi:MAG TPA: BlaI/MecI/CopY family transcriptional regulator [Hyphomonadaceae bacterium]|nr:BlaI/MecI/CopY family transcriptional regulator [Hyphomonadaceae bacterium]
MTPTANKTELTILKQLWTNGRMSAREVHDAITEETGWSYSTTRTVLTRMEEKGLLKRAEVHGVAVFSSRYSRVQVLGAMARELTRQVFDIKSELPASMFADSPHLTEKDLAELDAILNADAEEEDGK